MANLFTRLCDLVVNSLIDLWAFVDGRPHIQVAVDGAVFLSLFVLAGALYLIANTMRRYL